MESINMIIERATVLDAEEIHDRLTILYLEKRALKEDKPNGPAGI
jgi:hypothetical protein